jgi:DNA-binding NarL/FixJ family response regulator
MSKETEQFLSITVDAISGEITEREMTAEELAQRDAGQNAWLANEIKMQQKATARESALAKLAALGLTADEVAAL